VIRLRKLAPVLALLCALGVAAPAAQAADGDYHHVIRECYDTGALPGGKYTHKALKDAKKHLPSDIKEYSDCESLIEAALAYHPRNNSGGGGGGTPSTPVAPTNPAYTTPSGAVAGTANDLNALKQQTDPKTRSAAPPQVAIAGSKLSPTTGGLLNSAKHTDANNVPLPLILALAGLAAMAVMGLLAVLRQRWPSIRRAPLRLLRR
jgi:hypothetical protein